MSIKLYIGCMFSGKTSRLIHEYNRWENINRNAIMINYIDDNRYGTDNYVYSHDKNKIKCIKVRELFNISDKILKNNDLILINEGQFFPDLIDFCLKWCEEYNKDIIVCGLDGNFMRKPFGQINDLISISDEVTKLTAYCKKCNDGTKAIFSKRLSNEKENIVIGTDNYIPVCRKHYVEDK